MLSFVFSLMLACAHVASPWLASSIVEAVNRDPLPSGWSRELTASVLVVTAWEEGRFCYGKACAKGDGGRSVTTWQIMRHDPIAREALERDPVAAARFALAVVREGVRLCPDAPLAPYAGGCSNQAARAISDRRMERAKALNNR